MYLRVNQPIQYVVTQHLLCTVIYYTFSVYNPFFSSTFRLPELHVGHCFLVQHLVCDSTKELVVQDVEHLPSLFVKPALTNVVYLSTRTQIHKCCVFTCLLRLYFKHVRKQFLLHSSRLFVAELPLALS